MLEEKKEVKEEKEFEKIEEPKKEERKSGLKVLVGVMGAVLIALVVIILLMMRGCVPSNTTTNNNTPLDVEKTQQEYVAPEEPVNRSKQVSLPGWGGFTIPANTTTITKGFEFHNPEENVWYEDHVSIDGEYLEDLIVDSGEKVSLDHYLGLVDISSKVVDVTDYDSSVFSITDEETDNGIEKHVEAIGFFDGEKNITVTCEDGSTRTITFECEQDYYYMTFALYLTNTDGGEDTLLYQSGLVEPGKYIQEMEMTKALDAGVYDAYVLIQPYRSDGTTQTNYGQVNITLTVQ